MLQALRSLGRLLVFILGSLWVIALLARLLIELVGRLRRCIPKPPPFLTPTQPECHSIPAHIYRRADPMIYSQQYLMSQGLAVTWDNPDIKVELGGVTVDPHDLKPNTNYDVVAQVWNGSVNAPAIGLLVQFSYLSFGIGTQKNLIGVTHVDLGAKGAPNCPAFAHQAWLTPAAPSHYCLLVTLIWDDDANPLNNVGQSNTDVKSLNSPRAAFGFEVANTTRERHVYRFALDAYTIPALPSCADQPPARFPTPSPEELQARVRKVRAQHNPAAFPVPLDWSVVVTPAETALDPGKNRQVTVTVTAPDKFSGRRSFNVHGFDERRTLVGGVTLTVEG